MTSIAVITGANSGIGLECCKQLLALDWMVFALDLSVEALEPLKARDSVARLNAIRCDVSNADAVARTFSEIATYTSHIDALICSAGVLRTSPLMDTSQEDFDLLFAVNTRGPWLCAKAAMPLLKKYANADRPARIVMIASIAAIRPKVGGGAYAASKAALAQIVRVMGVELGASHIRVNAVAPATVDTPMIRNAMTADRQTGYRPSGVSPIGRVAVASDIVDVIHFLLSPASNFVNGAMIPVDGGTSAAFIANGSLESGT